MKTPTKGSAPAWSAAYNAATNWQMGVQYDANGNPPVGTFDVENRLVSEIDPSTGDTVSWLYDPWGKRVIRQDQTTGASQYTLYGVTGQRLAVLACTSNGQWSTCATANSNVYFKGRLLMKAAGGYMPADRLGSVGTGSAYFPYGEEQGSPPTPTGVERFATYYRDFVGQDYADQRYYNSIGGRFMTPDPGGIRTADPKNPGSWNRYAYVNGDPVNYFDPGGQLARSAGDIERLFSDAACEPSGYCNVYPCGGGWSPVQDPDRWHEDASGCPVPIPAPSASGSSYVGFKLAIADLKDKPNCATLIGGGSVAAGDLIDDLNNAKVTTGTDHGNGPVQVTTNPDGTYSYTYQWAYTQGGNIQLNANYFPDPSQQNVQVGDTTVSLVQLVNNALGSSLTTEQFGALVFLHELSHIVSSASSIDSDDYNQKLITDCLK